MDQSKDAPSPSPPPQAPVSQEPGPRAQNLNKVFTGALNHTVSTCSYAHFAPCFPTPARYNKPLLESVWRQVQNMVETRSRREFDDILVEKDVVKGLNELDSLIAHARGRREKNEEPSSDALHEVSPQQLVLAHMLPYLNETATKLDARMNDLQTENAQLVAELQRQEVDINQMVSSLEMGISDLQSGNDAMQAPTADGAIKKDANEIESEMAHRKDNKNSRL